MKVLVFGGAGFLGSYVVDELVARGYSVTIFDRRSSKWTPATADVIAGDIFDRDAVAQAATGFDIVYNFAGFSDLNASIDQPVETVALNVLGNLNVLEACRSAKVGRFLYASSVYVFSTKGAFYGVSKKASELLVEEYRRQYDLNYTILRYGSVYGERADQTNRLYRLLREALTKGEITFLGNGLEEREYIHGRDAARLSVDVLVPEYCNANVMLTGGERYRYKDLLELIREILDGRVEIALLDREYKGHYQLTPYSFAPSVGKKLVCNPSVDFGQGLLECIQTLCHDLGLVGDLPAVAEHD